jgi:D-sedoheptulose 7-phosphate isomerase
MVASFDCKAFFAGELAEHLTVAAETRVRLGEAFERLVELAVAALQGGGKLLFFGNGGSAADAQHLATEFTVRYIADRPALAALALTTDGSALSAAGNDLGFEQVFARQIEALGRAGDLAIGLSTSGKSRNVLLALERARALGLSTAGLAGKDGGQLAPLCDCLLVVPSETTARIQEMHIALGQMLCGAVERRLGLA